MVSVGLSGPDKDIVPDLKLPHGDKSLSCLSKNWSWENISKSLFHFVIGSHFSIWILQTSLRIDKVNTTIKKNFMKYGGQIIKSIAKVFHPSCNLFTFID